MTKLRLARLVPLTATAALVLAPAAGAAAPGKYTGNLYGQKKTDKKPYKGVKVSMKVPKGAKKVTRFSVSIAPVYCVNILNPSSGTVRMQTIYVPAAKIKGNTFEATYKARKDGRVIGTNKLKGTFSGSTASGTISTQSGGCNGGYRFKVKRK